MHRAAAVAAVLLAACGATPPPEAASFVTSSLTGWCPPAEVLDPVTGGLVSEPRCGSDGWCVVNPGVGERLTALWAATPDDAWATTDEGTVLRFDGTVWRVLPQTLPPGATPSALWGASSIDLWIGGAGGVARWDGATLTSFPLAGASAGRAVLVVSLSGTAADDVWALTSDAETFHWDGSRWEPRGALLATTTPVMGGVKVFALARGEAFALHGRGCHQWSERGGPAFWRPVECGIPVPRGVWGSGPDDVWVVGTGVSTIDFQSSAAYVARWDGQRWTVLVDPRRGPLWSVFGFGRNDVWIDGRFHWDGRAFSEECPPVGGVALLAGAGGRLFGHAGGISVRDGGAWRRQVSLSTSWADIGSGGDGRVWAVTSDGIVATFDGGRWAASPPRRSAPSDVRSAFGTPDDLWVVATGPDTTERLPGSWPDTEVWAWSSRYGWWTRSEIAEPGARTGAAWASGDAILFGDRTWRWNGIYSGWSELAVPFSGRDVVSLHAPSPSSVWISTLRLGGSSGGVWRWDGGALSQVPAPDSVSSVFEAAPGDAWATGRVGCPGACRPVLLHLEGGRFVEVDTPTEPLQVAGSGPDDLWVFDWDRGVCRPDGTRASFMPAGQGSWDLWGERGVGTFAVRRFYGTIAQRLRR